MNIQQALSLEISQATGEKFNASSSHDAVGGSINRSITLTDGQRSFFVKLNQADQLAMFEAEAEGLNELRANSGFVIPEVIACGSDQSHAWLILEKLHFRPSGSEGYSKAGETFAAMHQHKQARFGWHRNNTIGLTPQENDWTASWTAFWQKHRLGFQIRLARQNGFNSRTIDSCEQLNASVGLFFDHDPQPSLLHGDLWSGNLAFTAEGRPTIYDPALYYGDREADLAMTELFGGFSAGFYEAYRYHYPLHSGYRIRKQLYNLYHVLNHMNLFGGGYENQAFSISQKLLGEIK